jgi:hypothetical protein
VVVPGWGLLATGDRRGVLVLVIAIAWLIGLGTIAAPYADGTAATLVFLAGAGLAIFWAAQALFAWRRAVRRREAAGLATDDGGAMALLWLAPVVVAAATVFWSIAGGGAGPGARGASYAEAWWAGRAERASAGFVEALDAATLEAAWERQSPRLRNLLVSAAAQAGPAGGIDPDRPFDSIRSTEEPGDGADGTTRTIRLELVRRVAVRDSLLGFLQTTSQRLEPVADVGTIELRLVRTPGPVEGMPRVESWRIVRVVALGETIGG